jgi:hypothetical protein
LVQIILIPNSYAKVKNYIDLRLIYYIKIW